MPKQEDVYPFQAAPKDPVGGDVGMGATVADHVAGRAGQCDINEGSLRRRLLTDATMACIFFSVVGGACAPPTITL
jgi:hypothetical protein